MKHATINIVRIGALLLLAMLDSVTFALSHDSEVLNRIDSQVTTSGVQFTILFNIPMQYLNHTPSNEGKYFLIKVKPLGINPPDVAAFTRAPQDSRNYRVPERLSWHATTELPLTEVRYEGDEPTGAQIEVAFKTKVKFSVSQGKDFRSIIVKLLKDPQSQGSQPPEKTAQGTKYALNLLTSDHPIDFAKHSQAIDDDGQSLYTHTTQEKGVTKYHLRYGVLRTVHQVKEAMARFKPQYRDSRVVVVSDQELAAQGKSAPFAIPPDTDRVNRISVKGSPEELLDEAKRLMLATKYREAIAIYNHIIQKYPKSKYAVDALEYQGLARQRNLQVAHAKADFELYLKLYPNSAGAPRVKQRLDTLLTAAREPNGEVAKQKTDDRSVNWRTSGNIYASFRTDKTKISTSPVETETKSVVTSFNAMAQRRSETSDVRIRFSGSYADDLIGGRNGELITNYFYVDYRSKVDNWAGRVGRQSQNSGGVLGRFDGVSVDYVLSPKWKLNAVSGIPVNYTKSNEIKMDRYFYGGNLDYAASKYLTYNMFTIQQTVDGITDRTSIGGEIRYLHPKHAIFALVDYDVSYNELNALILANNWRFDNEATLNFVYDFRKSPILTTSNALQGQSVAAIEDLLKLLTEDQIRQLALNRTSEYTSYSISGTYPLAKDWLVYGDIVLSNLHGTAATTLGTPVSATPDTGNEYYYSTQLIRTNLFTDSDMATLGIRYADASAYDKTTYTLSYRYPLSPTIRLVPRFDIEEQSLNDGTEISTLRPSMRVEYRPWRRVRFELEGGTAKSEFRKTATPRDETLSFVSLALIADF